MAQRNNAMSPLKIAHSVQSVQQQDDQVDASEQSSQALGQTGKISRNKKGSQYHSQDNKNRNKQQAQVQSPITIAGQS